jgi:exodeoxyribonuclease VII small subunit
MVKKESKAIEGMSYEEAFAELETVVAALESGERQLEESMHLFERGLQLSKHCSSLLDKAELKVQVLMDETLKDLEAEQ